MRSDETRTAILNIKIIARHLVDSTTLAYYEEGNEAYKDRMFSELEELRKAMIELQRSLNEENEER